MIIILLLLFWLVLVSKLFFRDNWGVGLELLLLLLIKLLLLFNCFFRFLLRLNDFRCFIIFIIVDFTPIIVCSRFFFNYYFFWMFFCYRFRLNRLSFLDSWLSLCNHLLDTCWLLIHRKLCWHLSHLRLKRENHLHSKILINLSNSRIWMHQ